MSSTSGMCSKLTHQRTCLAVAQVGDPKVVLGRVCDRYKRCTPLQASRCSGQVLRPRRVILEQTLNLRAGHSLQIIGAAREHARKLGRDRTVKFDNAVRKNPRDGTGRRMSPRRTEEQVERLFNHSRKHPSGVLHGGVSHMSYIYASNRALATKTKCTNRQKGQ